MKTTKNDDDLPRMDEQASSSDVATASADPKGSAHTPTPWRIQDRAFARKTSNYDRTYRLAVLGPNKNGSSPTVAYGVGEWGGEGTANAEFIVRACNSHAELLAALKADLEDRHACETMRFRARAAIAKAEGRS